MNMQILVGILLGLAVYQQGTVTAQYPVGPRFVSTVASKQRLYYNNLGLRLDCSATGTPSPVLTWFRTNGTDDQPSTFVQSSELIETYDNGSLFIRPFREYSKAIHAGTYVCRAENAAGSVQTTPVQLKPQIYDTYEIEVKNTFGFEQSSVILSCEISPPSAASYVQIVGWLEKVNRQVMQLDLRPRSKHNLLSNKNLIIHNITKSDDNRTYACLVNNQIDNNTRQSRFKPLRVRDHSPFGPELSILNNTEYRARVGELVELPCGISSVPTHARISWWKNGVDITNFTEQIYDHSLILPLEQSVANDSGHYICRIDDESGGRITSHMSLRIEVPIQCEMFLPQTNINAGSSAELTCTSNALSTRPTQWQWYHNSQLILLNSDRYSMNNVTRAQMGMYQCCYISSSSDFNSCCAQSQLRVINSPPFILTDQQTRSNMIIVSSNTTSHAPIDLNCTVYGDPIPNLQIFKDGRQIVESINIEYLPSGDIFTHYPIRLVNLNDTGLYECRARNLFGSANMSKHVNIKEQPPFIQPIENTTISSGQEFTLVCYGSGQPGLQLTWIDEATKQILNTSFTSPLLLTSVNTRSNLYSCQAKNPHGYVSMYVHVTVQIPARILSTTSNVTVRVNESVNVYCLAEGDQKFEVVLLNPQSKRVSTKQSKMEHRKNVSLTIGHVQMADSGSYQCYASNDYSEDRSYLEIIVQNIPDRIANVFIENSHQISWIKPFDGNAELQQYILRIRYQQGASWSNETVIAIDDTDRTSYAFDTLYSECTMSIRIEAVNIIGSSLPSDPLHLQTNSKQLLIAPYNLTSVHVLSKSVTLSWQYPSQPLCHSSSLHYVVEIVGSNNETTFQTVKDQSTEFTVENLRSFTTYAFTIYAANGLGRSPRSTSLAVQTLESVPLATVVDLNAVLWNVSTARITWTFKRQDFLLLNGKFRAFAVTLYRNFNMSTLMTMETVNSYLIVENLSSSSQYTISVAICNHANCGPSSFAIHFETLSSSSDTSIALQHPLNKPLHLECQSSSSAWLLNRSAIPPFMVNNNSLFIAHPKPGETDGQFQCGDKNYSIQLYDKPSTIQTSIYYTTSDEIGLRLLYPFAIVESLTISYQARSNGLLQEFQLSPPVLNVRLANLSCGNIYDITIYATNQAGSSARESLVGKTDGSAPRLIEPKDLIRVISNHFIILNMSNWIINQCSILSYEIEIVPMTNASEAHLNRFFSYKNTFNEILIDNLEPNQDYQLHLKVTSQSGMIMKIISFRTTDEDHLMHSKNNHRYLITLIGVLSLTFFLVSVLITCLLIKFCRRHLEKAELFVGKTRKLKPVIYSSYPHHYHSTWLKSDNEFTVQNYTKNKIDDNNRPYSYASEDSQGNINPYAVTGCTLHGKDDLEHAAAWRAPVHNHCLLDTIDLRPSTTPSERYFRPIILESSLLNNPEAPPRNPLVQMPSKCSTLLHQGYPPPQAPSSVLSTVSSSQGELFSAFTYVPSSKQATLNTKKFPHHNPMLADQSSSSADSGVHSSSTQSPIVKHSLRQCQVHGFSFDRPSSAHAHDNQDTHFYATYDQQFAFLRETAAHHASLGNTTPSPPPSSSSRSHHQEQYSLV